MEFDFSKSNDPWINNGAVILFNYIDENEKFASIMEENNIKYDLNDLKIFCPSINDLKEFLQLIVDDVQDNNYIRSKNKDLIIENNHLKLIDRLSFSPLISFFFKGKRPKNGKKIPIENLNECIKAEYEEYKTKQKDIRIVDSSGESNKIDLNRFNSENTCDFCNQKFLSSRIQTTYYPFTASLGKYKNFNSNFKRGMHICILCAVSSLMVYYNLPYAISDKFLFFTFPIITIKSENQKIWKFLETNTGISIFNEYSNFSKKTTRDPFYSFIDLIKYIDNKIVNNINSEIEAPENEIDIVNAWKSLSWIIGYSTSDIIRSLYTYNNTKRLFQLIETLDRKNIDLPTLVRKFILSNNSSNNYVYEKEISRKIVFFEDVNHSIELFYGEYIKNNNTHIKGLNTFLYTYNKEVMKMYKKLIDTCFYMGATIGEYCKGDDSKPEDKDMLYELRSCTNVGQFLQFLDGATFKIENLNVPMNFLKEMNTKNWQDMKSLISIFAHQIFYKKGNPTQGENIK
jgi:hypothetical protein